MNSGHDNPACFSAGPCHVLPEKPQKPHPFLYSTVCPFMVDFASLCALNIFGKNSQHFWQNILGKWELEIVIFKPPFLPLILRILL